MQEKEEKLFNLKQSLYLEKWTCRQIASSLAMLKKENKQRMFDVGISELSLQLAEELLRFTAQGISLSFVWKK